jgi:peptide deformylase
VKFPASASVRKLVKDMIDTVRHAKGIGLAAPQVGQALNVIVIDLEHMGLPIFAMLNPKVVAASKKSTKMEEGCLSIPGVYGIVSRPEQITFSGYSIDGKHMQFEADGLLAKVLQHETDHVNGVLIIDKISKYTEGKDLVGEKPLI